MVRIFFIRIVILLGLLVLERVGFAVPLSLAFILASCVWFIDTEMSVVFAFSAGLMADLVFMRPVGVSSLILLFVVALMKVSGDRFGKRWSWFLFVVAFVVSLVFGLLEHGEMLWLPAFAAAVLAAVIDWVGRDSKPSDDVVVRRTRRG